MTVYIKNKKIGETPLECLERTRQEEGISKETSMTFAGRLDPAASGEIIFLTNEDIKQKDNYLNTDKLYQVELLFGISTDTGDLLGLIKDINFDYGLDEDKLNDSLEKLTGQRIQKFHNFSSKVVDGKPLWQHAKEGSTLEVSHQINIYSIDLESIKKINIKDIYNQVQNITNLVNGDFRQKDILSSWQKENLNNKEFNIATVLVKASSGSYMRVLAEELGILLNVPICAYGINRIKVFLK